MEMIDSTETRPPTILRHFVTCRILNTLLSKSNHPHVAFTIVSMFGLLKLQLHASETTCITGCSPTEHASVAQKNVLVAITESPLLVACTIIG